MDRRATAFVRLWSLKNVFLLWFVKPRVLELTADRCVVRLPLSWRTKNHLGSMYFGALCIGADVAGGLIAFRLAQQKKMKISFVFKDVRGEFLKRAEGDVVFTNTDGPVIADVMQRAMSGERAEGTVNVVATVPSKLGDEPVAKFALTLSVKRRG
jgi:acyl-coenzyme A thioesterase PaaI-like protein